MLRKIFNKLNKKHPSLEFQFGELLTRWNRNPSRTVRKVKKLIKKGLPLDKAPIDLNRDDYRGDVYHLGAPPALIAVGNYAVIQTLADYHADLDAKHISDGETALILAARLSEIDSLYVLLYNGANPNLQDNTGKTALMWAALSKNPDRAIIKALLRYNADASLTDGNGDTAFSLAKKSGQDALADLIQNYHPPKKKHLLSSRRRTTRHV